MTRARGACTACAATVRCVRRHPTFVKRFYDVRSRDIVDINCIIIVVINFILLLLLIIDVITVRHADRVAGHYTRTRLAREFPVRIELPQ